MTTNPTNLEPNGRVQGMVLDSGQPAALADEAAFQPGGEDWIVLLDPDGHPSCIMAGE